MRTKMVKRHRCDFCNRAGLRAHAMAKHERHCTMNPARSCRTCTLINGGNGPDSVELHALVAILAEPGATAKELATFEKTIWRGADADESQLYNLHGELQRQIAVALPTLREAADGCPACMLAAIRQAGVPVPLVDGFDFKKEMAEVLDAARREAFENVSFGAWP